MAPFTVAFFLATFAVLPVAQQDFEALTALAAFALTSFAAQQLAAFCIGQAETAETGFVAVHWSPACSEIDVAKAAMVRQTRSFFMSFSFFSGVAGTVQPPPALSKRKDSHRIAIPLAIHGRNFPTSKNGMGDQKTVERIVVMRHPGWM